MSRPYFSSAQEAAAGLGLPLLLASGSGLAVPRSATRLSAHAPDPILGARLYHRLRTTAAGNAHAVWITSPAGTSEQMSWAVGLAEQAARDGRTAYLVDLDRSSPLRFVVAGHGHRLPDPLLRYLQRLGLQNAAEWASDMQGVRVVLPAERDPEGERMGGSDDWLVVLASSTPESPEVLARISENVDGVILAAGIRDHTEEELREEVEPLRRSGAELLGLIAMGPVPRTQASPLDRWERSKEGSAGEIERSDESIDEPLVPSEEDRWQAEPMGDDSGEDSTSPREAPEREAHEDLRIGLVTEWERRRKKKRGRSMTWFAVALLVGVVAFWRFGPWESLFRTEKQPPPVRPTSGGRNLATPAPTESTRFGDSEPTASPPRGESMPVEQDASISPLLPAVDDTTSAAGGAGETMPSEDSSAPDQAVSVEQESSADSSGPVFEPQESERLSSPPPGSTEPEGLLEDRLETVLSTTDWPDTFVIHLSSFHKQEEANRALLELSSIGLTGRVVPVALEGLGEWLRVVVGQFPDSLSAAVEAERLRREQLVPFTQILGRNGLGNGRPTGGLQ